MTNEVRIATQADREAMIPLLMLMHEENGVASLSKQKMLRVLDQGLARDKALIGVIEKNGQIRASIGLLCHFWWYSEDPHLEDIFCFVHPQHRKSDYARQLLQFAKTSSDMLGIQLLIGVLSDDRTLAKVRLYEREFGPSVGAAFVYPAVNKVALRHDQKEAA